MTVSIKGIDRIKAHEACRLTAYQDIAGIWTIGYGIICYPDGTPVKKGDVISSQKARDLLAWQIGLKTTGVREALGNTIVTQNQYDALVSFAYNLGVGALKGSTLLRKVKANPNDPAIRAEFAKWNKARNPKTGKLEVSKGLTRRRAEESDLYFTA